MDKYLFYEQALGSASSSLASPAQQLFLAADKRGFTEVRPAVRRGAMEYANRDEAVRCLEYARSALLSRDISKARRLAEKSLHLCPTQECRGGF